jgi:hypothetical protein
MLSRKFFFAPRSWCLGIGGSLYMVTDLLPRKRLPFLPGAVSDAQNEGRLFRGGRMPAGGGQSKSGEREQGSATRQTAV